MPTVAVGIVEHDIVHDYIKYFTIIVKNWYNCHLDVLG